MTEEDLKAVQGLTHEQVSVLKRLEKLNSLEGDLSKIKGLIAAHPHLKCEKGEDGYSTWQIALFAKLLKEYKPKTLDQLVAYP